MLAGGKRGNIRRVLNVGVFDESRKWEYSIKAERGCIAEKGGGVVFGEEVKGYARSREQEENLVMIGRGSAWGRLSA
jgi:hypothetical protein